MDINSLPQPEQGLYRTVLQMRINKRTKNHTTVKGRKVSIQPEYALFIAEILPVFAKTEYTRNEIQEGLNRLCKMGLLRFGEAANDIYFEINDG